MFSQFEAYAGDPIFSLQAACNNDPRPEKINLSIGFYYDDAGQIPVLESVQKASTLVNNKQYPGGYLPMSGSPVYCQASQELIFANTQALHDKRIATIQTLGGSGALKVGADILKQYFPEATVHVSSPTWDNHRAIFSGAGFAVKGYPYFDAASGKVAIDELCAYLETLPTADIVLLHPCCHNPTGADLSPEQWDRVVAIIKQRQLIAFLDMAYQGFGKGLYEDAYLARALADAGCSFLLGHSYSKVFSLYAERCGSLSMVCASHEEAQRVLGQLQQVVRRNYSSPPAYGARVIETVLTNTDLRALWESEVTEMRVRIQSMRQRLREGLERQQPSHDWQFITQQAGLFSYALPWGKSSKRLQSEFAVYILDSGRICVAGLNTSNVDRAATAFAGVGG